MKSDVYNQSPAYVDQRRRQKWTKKQNIHQIVSSHFLNETIETIQLPSKLGYDNIIYLVQFCSGTVVVFRRPLKIDSSKISSEFKLNSHDNSMPYFPMHRVGHQAWMLEILKGQPFSPKLLALNIEENYLIESYILGIFDTC